MMKIYWLPPKQNFLPGDGKRELKETINGLWILCNYFAFSVTEFGRRVFALFYLPQEFMLLSRSINVNQKTIGNQLSVTLVFHLSLWICRNCRVCIFSFCIASFLGVYFGFNAMLSQLVLSIQHLERCWNEYLTQKCDIMNVNGLSVTF